MASPEEFIEISDFRAGIWSDMHGGVLSSGVLTMTDAVEGYLPGDGAATVENTNGCRADKTGALIPLPVAFGSAATVSGTPTDDYTTANRPAAMPRAYLLDAEISPPRWYLNGEDSLSAEKASVFTLWGFQYEPDGTGVANGYYSYVLGREYRIGAFWQSIYDYLFIRTDFRLASAAYTNVVPAGSVTLARFDDNASEFAMDTFGAQFKVWQTNPVLVAVATCRTAVQPDNRQLETGAIPASERAWLTDYVPSPGGVAAVKRPSNYSPHIHEGAGIGVNSPTVIGMSLGATASGTGNAYDVTGTKPDDEWVWHSNDLIESDATLNAPYAPYMIVAHQGRVVLPDLAGAGRLYTFTEEYNPAAAQGFESFFSDDVLWYSRWGQPIGEVVDVGGTDYTTSYIPLLVAEDQVANIGVLGVVTADELLVVKATGGGALVRGDLDNPTVRRLPHIEPTYNTACKGAQTPIGYVYGSTTGVHAFDGGDTTRKLSTQLDGFFWNPYPENPVITGSYGRFAYWNGMIHVPNNFIFDIETGGWWRWTVSSNRRFNIYLVSNSGDLWAFPAVDESTAAAPRSLFSVFNIDRLSASYSWQSQSLIETRGRRVSVQDIRILGTSKGGTATFTVTLSGFNEDGQSVTSDAITLTFDDNERPQLLREDVTPNFVAEYVQVRVVASGTDRPAPKLHSLRIGIRPRQTTPRHG